MRLASIIQVMCKSANALSDRLRLLNTVVVKQQKSQHNVRIQ